MATRPSSPPHLLPVHRSLVDRGGASVAGMAMRRPSGDAPTSYRYPDALSRTLAYPLLTPLSLSRYRSRPPPPSPPPRRSGGHRPPLLAPRRPGASPSSSRSPTCSESSRDSPYARHRAHLRRVHRRRSSLLPRLRSTSGLPDRTSELAVSSPLGSSFSPFDLLP